MIVPDVNLLIYAVNRDAPSHPIARDWLEQTLSGTTRVSLAWLVVIAFIRITANPRMLDNPLSPESALRYVSGWLEQPVVQPLNPGRTTLADPVPAVARSRCRRQSDQ